jgi:curli biogenesis system outer membrane secretion channel CsgG
MLHKHLNLAVLAVFPFATAAFAGDTTVTENDIGAYVPHCAAPVASVSVGRLTCKAAGCQKTETVHVGGLGGLAQLVAQQAGIPTADLTGIGDGMANALTTALKATGCFDIQERETMEELQKEAELSGIKLQIKPSDYMISGAITTVALETARSSFGGGFIPIVGAFNKTTQTAKLGMDLRVVDVKKANIMSSKSFSANSENSSWGVGGAGWGGGGALFGGHSVTKSPEMDKVASETVIYAVGYLVDTLAGQSVVSRPVAKVAELKTKAEDKPASGFDQP